MVTVEDFSRLVSGIYAAAVTPDQWELALKEIRRAVDGAAGGLFMADSAVWSVLDSTLPVEAARSYTEYYHRLDHVLAAVGRGPVGVVRRGTELMPLVRNSEFHQEWLQPLGIDDGMFVRLTGAARPMCFIVGAPRRSESLDTPERVRLMTGLVPHMQQALRMQNKLAVLAESAVELAGALDVVRHGVVIVAGEHQVINVNSAGEHILRAEDGLCLRSGRIATTANPAGQELHCALQHALTGEGSAVRTGQSLTCVRPSGKRPYVIHVVPFHRRDADEPLRHPMALILIIDPEDQPVPAAALLRRLYRLTNAEADVALHIIHGTNPKHIADELSISLTTVRTHLQHVFYKTGTHRQAELVRLLLVLNP